MKTLHIFSYGDDQAINDIVNKKFNNNELLNHAALLNSLNITKEYIVISYINEQLQINYIDLTTDVLELNNELQILIDNLYNEIIEK